MGGLPRPDDLLIVTPYIDYHYWHVQKSAIRCRIWARFNNIKHTLVLFTEFIRYLSNRINLCESQHVGFLVLYYDNLPITASTHVINLNCWRFAKK